MKKLMIAVLLMFPNIGWACSCMPLDIERAWQQSDLVMYAEVSDIQPSEDFLKGKLTPIATYKGDAESLTAIYSAQAMKTSCDMQMTAGNYIIFYSGSERLVLHLCSYSFLVNEYNEYLLDSLEALKQGSYKKDNNEAEPVF